MTSFLVLELDYILVIAFTCLPEPLRCLELDSNRRFLHETNSNIEFVLVYAE